MTVLTLTDRNIYDGNGSTTVFPYTFRILQDSDLTVRLIDDDGTETTLALTTDYTVSGAGEDTGGNVTCLVAPGADKTVLVLRAVPYTQPTDYSNQGSFYPRTHERSYDRAAMQIQQLKARQDRSFELPAYVEGVSTLMPVPEPGVVWGWNPDGTAPRHYTPGEIATFSAFTNWQADTFSGSGSQTAFTLTSDPGVQAALDVSIDGVTQVPGTDYTLSGRTLTFSVAPAAATTILARYGQALPVPLASIGAALFPVSSYGATGDGTPEDIVKIEQAAAFAVASGLGLYFPPGSWDVDGADFQGANCFAFNDATLVGTPINTGKLRGLVIGTLNTSDIESGTLPPLSSSGLIAVQYRTVGADGDDAWYVLSKNPRRQGYVVLRMRSGVGDGFAPWDFIREQTTFAAYDCYAYQSILAGSGRASYTGAGWADYNITASVINAPTGATSGTENAYIVGRRTNGAADFVDVTVTGDERGMARLSFVQSVASTATATVSIGGTPVGVVGMTSPTGANRIVHFDFFVGFTASVVVRVTQGGGSGGSNYLVLAGLNAHRPQEAKPEIAYDNWAYYRLTPKDNYVLSNGAADYAIRDLDLGRLVGSYHGEDAAVTPAVWTLDGTTGIAWTKNVPKVGKGLLLRQHTLVAGKLAVRSDQTFGDGWIEKMIDITGNMRSDTAYLGMCLPQVSNSTDACFDELILPRRLDVSVIGVEVPLGHCELVCWRNARNEQRVYAWHRAFPHYNNMRGGAFIKSEAGSTTYSKLYHGLQIDAENQFTGAASHIIHLYC